MLYRLTDKTLSNTCVLHDLLFNKAFVLQTMHDYVFMLCCN